MPFLFAHDGLMTREQIALTIEIQLELRLSLESKEIADYNGATSEFTVSVRPHESYIWSYG
jgi:hypothetical protein